MHLHGTNSVVQFHFQNYMLNCLFSDLILDIVSANVRASIYFRTSNAMAKGFLLGKVYLRRRRVRYEKTVNSQIWPIAGIIFSICASFRCPKNPLRRLISDNNCVNPVMMLIMYTLTKACGSVSGLQIGCDVPSITATASGRSSPCTDPRGRGGFFRVGQGGGRGIFKFARGVLRDILWYFSMLF